MMSLSAISGVVGITSSSERTMLLPVTSFGTIYGSVNFNWFKFSWRSLNASSESEMLACWTSDLIPAFLKQ